MYHAQEESIMNIIILSKLKEVQRKSTIKTTTSHVFLYQSVYTQLLTIIATCIMYNNMIVLIYLMQISYDITSPEPDKISETFYRTLPSDRAANIGRLNLIARFKWFRIATISSQERYYAQVYAHNIMNLIILSCYMYSR